jgi:hypothetical protein
MKNKFSIKSEKNCINGGGIMMDILLGREKLA